MFSRHIFYCRYEYEDRIETIVIDRIENTGSPGPEWERMGKAVYVKGEWDRRWTWRKIERK